MACKESNSEENTWKKVLSTYEREPSDRAKRQFHARLASQTAPAKPRWIWGMAAGLVLLGAWWMLQPNQSELGVPVKLADATELNSLVPEEAIKKTVDDKTTSSGRDITVPVRTTHFQSEGEKVELAMNELTSKAQEEESISEKWSLQVEPLVVKKAMLSVPQDRVVDIAFMPPAGQVGTAESMKRNQGLGQLLDELMILKYGEPMDEKPALVAFLAGEEKAILATERAELKERFSWIKDKVTK